MIDSHHDRNHLVFAHTVARSWADPEVKKQLLQNPGDVLREAGMDLPRGIMVVAHEDTADVTHAVLPAGDLGQHQDQLRELARTLPAGHELRVVQNAPGELHVAIPRAPEGFQGQTAAVTSTLLSGPMAHLTQMALQDTNASVVAVVIVVVTVTTV